MIRRVVGSFFLSILLIQNPATSQTTRGRENGSLSEFSSSLQKISQRVTPAVVQVIASGYFPAKDDETDVTSQSKTGSGVILDPNGYIVTNAHVVDGADKVEVLLASPPGGSPENESGEEGTINADILGMDTEMDLAVLKINKNNLPFLKLADSSHIAQGELVLACGSPFGLQNTVSLGIVSSTSRQLQPDNMMLYIQTDAPINPGNSGGPLINMQGEVLGINTMIYSQSGGNQGLGFAIPSNTVNNIYNQLKTIGHAHHGYLGIDSRSVSDLITSALHLQTRRGILILDVDSDGPAAKAGVKPGDIITSMGGKPVSDSSRLVAEISQLTTGGKINVSLLRGSERQNLSLTVGERPNEELRFAHMVNRQSNLIRQFAILGLDVNDKVREVLPPLRIPAGVVVAAKVGGMPSPDEDFQPGDLISSVNGEAIQNLAALRAFLTKLNSGDAVAVQIQRGGTLMLLAFELP